MSGQREDLLVLNRDYRASSPSSSSKRSKRSGSPDNASHSEGEFSDSFEVVTAKRQGHEKPSTF